MAFDIQAFLVSVAGVVVGAYALNYLGYLNHPSPVMLYGLGITSAKEPARVYPKNFTSVDMGGPGSNPVSNYQISQPSIAPGSVGANELKGETIIRPL